MAFQLGLEVFLKDKKKLQTLKRKRMSLVCHPASVDQNLNHSFDLLQKSLKLTSAFGPQHGIKGEKQDNMIESSNFIDPIYQIPIFSLYGEVRRPTPEMMKSFDVLIFDLQDLGCRIYTFVTTLLYVMEECARLNKTLIVLDRPNPAGREVEGFTLEKSFRSFVGAAEFPMRHGLTTAEMALYFKDYFDLQIDLQIYKMKDYKPNQKRLFGWPEGRSWVNPSPNAATLNMARAYPGTVLIEGTTLSEGRGTTRALEQIGASDLDFKKILQLMHQKAPQWMQGALFRECYFEPTFHKYEKQLCHGFQIHTDHENYNPEKFKPFRLVALMLKCIRELYPDYLIYRDFAYEYTQNKLAFDVINGGPKLREWIEDSKKQVRDLEKDLKKDEKEWQKKSAKYFLYK
jgi:uncharacterized protein YbbC (DUF1343 family)